MRCEIERPALVGHGWGGAIALAYAQRHPDRLRRLVIVDAVPLIAGFAWPGPVRRVLRPVLGELWMGAVNQRRLARLLRSGAASPGAWSDDRVKAIWDQFDQGTQRAFLRLHRSIDAAGLAAAGSELQRVTAPALVMTGERDPWLAPAFASTYATRLPNATLQRHPRRGSLAVAGPAVGARPDRRLPRRAGMTVRLTTRGRSRVAWCW